MSIWSDEDIAALRKAIASGVQSVTFAGPPSRTVTYQSLRDMRDTLAEMLAQNAADDTDWTPYRLGATRKGL